MAAIEKFKYYYKLLLLNRKNALIMFFGLGISLALISEGLIFMYSFQYDAFQDFTKQTPTKQYTLSVDSINVVDKKDTSIAGKVLASARKKYD